MPNTSELNDLSNEVIAHIVECVDDANDFLNLTRVSYQMREICKMKERDKSLWRKMYAKKWQYDESELILYADNKDYKKEFKDRIAHIQKLHLNDGVDMYMKELLSNIYFMRHLEDNASRLLVYLTDKSISPKHMQHRKFSISVLTGEDILLSKLPILLKNDDTKISVLLLKILVECLKSENIGQVVSSRFIGYIGMLFDCLASETMAIRNLALYILYLLITLNDVLPVHFDTIGKAPLLRPFLFEDAFTPILCATRLLYYCFNSGLQFKTFMRMDILDRLFDLLDYEDENIKVSSLALISIYPVKEDILELKGLEKIVHVGMMSTSDTVTFSVLTCMDILIKDKCIMATISKGETIPFLRGILGNGSNELKQRTLVVIQGLLDNAAALERFSKIGGWDSMIANIKNCECPLVVTHIQTVLIQLYMSSIGFIRSGIRIEAIVKRACTAIVELIVDNHYEFDWLFETLLALCKIVDLDKQTKEIFSNYVESQHNQDHCIAHKILEAMSMKVE